MITTWALYMCNTFKKWIHYASMLDWRLDTCTYYDMHILLYAHLHDCIYVHVTVTYFLSCYLHECSYSNFTIILHIVSYNTCNSDYWTNYCQ